MTTTLLLGLLALATQAPPATAQETRTPAEARPDPDQLEDNWFEDPERVRVNWRDRMSPEDYRAALVSTGMQKALDGGLVDVPPPGGVMPASAGTWTLAGPRGAFDGRNGRVSDIHFQPFGGTTYVYVGACQGGLWRSTTSALGIWTPLGDNLPNPSVGAVAVEPGDPSHIFAGTGDAGRYGGSGLYETDDYGATWNLVSLPINPSAFYRLHINAPTAQFVLAATDLGLVRTTNFGVSWPVVLAGDITDLVAHPTNSSIFYAVSAGVGVFKSTTGGASWTPLSDPDLPPTSQWGRSSLAVCRSNPNVVALLVSNANKLQGVYRTTNGGSDWIEITGSLPGSWAMNSEANHAQSIAIQPDTPDKIYVAMRGLAVTFTAGSSWAVETATHGIDFGHADLTELRFSPHTGDNTLWICNDGGIYKHTVSTGTTVDGIGGANGLAICEVDFMDADRGMRVLGLQDNGVLRTLDAGSSWTALENADGGAVEITDPLTSEFWYLHGFYSPPPTWRMFRQKFGAAREDMQHPGAWNPMPFRDPFGSVVYTSDQNRIVSLPVNAAPGTAWTTEIASIAQNSPYSIRRLSASRADGRTLFVKYWGSMTVENLRDVTIFQPSGSSWVTHHTENLVASGSQVEVITPSTEWPGECWVGVKGPSGQPKVFHTVDFGDTWEDLTNELAGVTEVTTVVNTPFDPLTLYAATNVGVFRTLDGGASWQPFQDGLPIARCSELIFVPDDSHSGVHKLVLSTDGRAVWTRDIVAPPIHYVDKKHAGPSNGTFEYPHKSVGAALSVAPAGAVIAVRSDTYLEPQTVTKAVRVVTWSGTTVIR